MLTNFDSQDYEWVLKISKKRKKGISPKDIIKIAQEESQVLGHRPRNEKPPGRDKIYEIIKRGAGTDWDYVEGGGNSKTSLTSVLII